MTIYIDSDFLCYTENSEGRIPIETNFFNGKCKAFIEGYRFVPDGHTWMNKAGLVFHGEMAAPVIDYTVLLKIQDQYEEDLSQMEDMRNALNILGVTE